MQYELQAQARLDDYLQALRTSLRRCRSLDPAEVERGVRARIEGELADAPRPVPLDFLQPVLDRLGSPTQWVPDEERPRWWRALCRLQGGPEGARLSYLAFGTCLAGLGLLAFYPYAGVPLLLAGFLLARAIVWFWRQRGRVAGARWAVYSPLIVAYLLLAAAVLLWPAPAMWKATGRFLRGEYGVEVVLWEQSKGRDAILLAWCSAAATAAWWAVAGFVAPFFSGLLATTFAPFVPLHREKRLGRRVMVAGLILMLAATLIVALGLTSLI